MLAKIRDEVGFMWNMSSNFEQISVDYPVISAYELLPSSYKIGFMRSRKDIVSVSLWRAQEDIIHWL